MTTTNDITARLGLPAALNAMQQGVMLFNAEGDLVLENPFAEQLLGIEMSRIRRDGWGVCTTILDAGKKPDAPEIDTVRAQALEEMQPVHFNTTLEGAFIPGYIVPIHTTDDELLTMLCLETSDWTALTDLMGTFRNEARQTITATRGSAELISKLAVDRPKGMTTEQLAGRVLGFADMIIANIYRFEMLMDLLHRWEIILTGRLAEDIKTRVRRVELDDWFEDYLEAMLEQSQIDPEIDLIDYQERLVTNIPAELYVSASRYHLGTIIRDLLRNAILYSPNDAPIIVQAVPLPNERHIRIDVIDRGIGVREKEVPRVFMPFQRARQPHVISQFGYGLSLFLCKAEMEAMGGSITFNSEEGTGSVFSLLLLRWEATQETEAEALD